jgi:hypothetical protein
MGAGGKFCHRVSDILASMSWAALWWGRWGSWLVSCRHVVVRAYRFGHLLRMGSARRGFAQSVSGLLEAGTTDREASEGVLRGAKYMLT